MRISDWSSDVCSSDLPWSARILTAPEFSGDHGSPCSCRCIRRGCRQTENDYKPSERGRDRRSSKAWGDLRPTSPKSSRCPRRSEEHTSELQKLMRISYAVLCFTKKHYYTYTQNT